METYIFNNKLYTREDLEGVAERKGYTFEELLQKNPSIKPSDLGNQPGVANETASATPLQRAVAGGYRPEGISLGLQDLEPQPAPKTRAELEEEEEQRQQEIDAKLFAARKVGGITSPAIGVIDKLLPDWYENYKTKKLAGLVGGASELARGIPEYIDASIQAGVGSTNPAGLAYYQAMQIARSNMRGDSLEEAANEGVIDTSGWRDFNSKLTSLNKKYFNDDGTEADFQELVSQGRTSEASDKLVSDAFIAVPSLAVSIAGGPLGIAALGVSAAGSSFERTMNENPDESIQKAFFISNIQGGVEATSEYFGGKFLKSIGKLTKVGKGANRKAVDEFIEKTSDKFLERAFGYTKKTGAGMLFEGGTEAGANIINESLQELAYSDDGLTLQEAGRIFTKSLNEFAVGAVLGGGTSIITQNLNKDGATEQNVAMHIAPNYFKNQVYKLEQESILLDSQIEKAKRKKDKAKFQTQQEETKKQIEEKKAQVVEAFNGLTREEKRSYADALDNIQNNLDLYYEKGTDLTREQLDEVSDVIKEDFRKLDDILAYEKLGIDANMEAAFTQVLQRSKKIESTIRNNKIAGLEVEMLDTQEKIDAAAEKYKGFDPDADGIFIPKATKTEPAKILINKDVAALKGATNVLGHEKLHFLLSKYFKTDNASLAPLVDSFKEYLVESGNSNIVKRIDQRLKENDYIDENGKYKKGALEEYFNMFSDIVATEKINVVETKGVANKLAKAYTNTMQGLGFASVKLNNGKDVFDFIRNYTKNIQKSDAILGVKLESDLVPKGKTTETKLSKTDSNKIDKAYAENKSPFEIAMMFEGIVSKRAQKYQNVPDFNTFKEDFIQSALLEKGGVIDLVNSYKEGTGTLSGYVNSLLEKRMDGFASKIFGVKFTEDITEKVDIAQPEAEPIEVTPVETPQTRNVIDRLNLSPSLADAGKTAVTKGLATVGAIVPLNKGFTFRENLKKNVRNAMFDSVKKELGGSSLPEYFDYIKANAEEIYNIITLGDLVKNKPLAEKFTTRPVDKQGRQLRKSETFSGRKTYAGNLVFEKKPWSPAVEKDFIAEFTEGRNARETRRLFLINTIAKEIAFDEALNVIKDSAVLEKIAATQPQDIMDNFTEELSRQVERGQFIKYSKSKALDNWIVDSTKAGDTSLIGKISNEIYDVLQTMQPTGKYKYNEDMDFGTAFVKYFNPPKKYANDIENDLNKLWRQKIVDAKGTFSLKGTLRGEGPKDLKLGLFTIENANDKAYEYVAFRLTGEYGPSKSWVTPSAKKSKLRNDEYENILFEFANAYLTDADLRTGPLRQNVFKQMVGEELASDFDNNLNTKLNINSDLGQIDGVERTRKLLSTFAGTEQIKRKGIDKIAAKATDGDLTEINAHNNEVTSIVRPQYKRIMLSLYDFVESYRGTGNEQMAMKFANRFQSMMFKGGTTYTPMRESAAITHVEKNITEPYAEHAKQIEKLANDFMLEQDGDNFLAAYITGGRKGRRILERAIDKMFATNGVFIVDKIHGDIKSSTSMDAINGKFGLPNQNYVTSRFQNVLDEGDIIPIESGIALTEGDTYDLNKGLNAQVFDASAIDEANNKLYIKFSKTRSKPAELADMIDRKNVKAKEIKSAKDLALARRLGKETERKFFYGNDWNIFLPYSAEDFYGLIQKIAGKGEQGNKDLKFLKENLLDTYSQGISDLETDRRSMFNAYRQIKARIKKAPFKLRENLTEEGVKNFTIEDAVRVFVWQQSNYDIPGITKKRADKLSKIVADNKELRSFAFGLMAANKTDGYPKPEENWEAGKIGSDFAQTLNQNKRPKYLKKWQHNIDLIFNDKNKAKLTAAFGPSYVKNLEMVIGRMKSGVNRKPTNSDAANITQDFINGSVGTIMSFNMRSATLQSISAINYLNWSDNNPLMVAKALANPKQFAKDFMFLMNSDYLTNRRQGLKINVQEAEIAEAAKSKNPVKAVIAHMLKIGFLPTQIMDSVAIASGGSAFYRNRINSYVKKGFTQEQAEKKSYEDWRQISNESQQSSDPARISNVQANNFGRVVFAFANTPFQYTRLTKRAISDLVNGRGDVKTNVSKITYYMAVQNIIFNTLQSAYFALDFSEEDEYQGRKLTRRAKEIRQSKIDKKEERIVNGMADSVLRGLGYSGALISMLKNAGIAYYKEQQKENEFFKDWSNVLLATTDIAPPIDHKVRKLKAIIEAGKYESNIPPSVEAAINALAIANIPADRLQRKIENLADASREDLSAWTRIALFLGWSGWELGIED